MPEIFLHRSSPVSCDLLQELATKLMELVSVAPVEVQRDIITSLPEILEDSQHNDIAKELKCVHSVPCDERRFASLTLGFRDFLPLSSLQLPTAGEHPADCAHPGCAVQSEPQLLTADRGNLRPHAPRLPLVFSFQWSFLLSHRCSHHLLSQVRGAVMATLAAVQLEDLPVVVRFILHSATSADAYEVRIASDTV